MKQTKQTLSQRIQNVVSAFFQGVCCPECKTCNVKLKEYSAVDPETIEDALYIAQGYSLAAQMGLKSSRGNYKKTRYGNIYQTRDEKWYCFNCGNKFRLRREHTIARSSPL